MRKRAAPPTIIAVPNPIGATRLELCHSGCVHNTSEKIHATVTNGMSAAHKKIATRRRDFVIERGRVSSNETKLSHR